MLHSLVSLKILQFFEIFCTYLGLQSWTTNCYWNMKKITPVTEKNPILLKRLGPKDFPTQVILLGPNWAKWLFVTLFVTTPCWLHPLKFLRMTAAQLTWPTGLTPWWDNKLFLNSTISPYYTIQLKPVGSWNFWPTKYYFMLQGGPKVVTQTFELIVQSFFAH